MKEVTVSELVKGQTFFYEGKTYSFRGQGAKGYRAFDPRMRKEVLFKGTTIVEVEA